MELNELSQYLPLLVPVFLIQIGLMLAALVDLLRRERTRGPKWAWLLVILLVNIVGPIIYFLAGRTDE
jgi:hypothetical protein